MIVKVKYRLSGKTIEPDPAAEGNDRCGTCHDAGRARVRGTGSDARLRRTEVRWIMPDEHPFVHEELVDVVRQHQDRMGISAPLYVERGVQLATYHVGDHYNWHEDGHPGDGTRQAAVDLRPADGGIRGRGDGVQATGRAAVAAAG